MFHPTQLLLNRRWAFGGISVIGLAISCAKLTAEEPRPTYGDLPAEIQQIQRSLGGPQTNHFPTLSDRAESFSHPAAHGRGSEPRQPEAIFALRDAAAQLDSTANRLEQLELYAQADALRQQAQRLRIDARGMSGGASDPQPAVTPTPAQWLDPRQATPPDWNSSMPQLRPSPARRPRVRQAPPDTDSRPALEPVPQPEIPHDAPKPQPLLDSPEATPKPDVEVEG